MLLNGNFVAVDHGGSLDRARKLFPAAPEPWVDLSTGINPHSYPLFDLPATAFTRLPEPSRHRELCAIAAAAYGAPGAQSVAAAPGSRRVACSSTISPPEASARAEASSTALVELTS